jgi:hypothetical protein
VASVTVVGVVAVVRGPSSYGGPSAGLQEGLVALRQDLVAHFGVGDGPVLLPQVEPQLALVSEVEVTFLTLQSEGRREGLCVN